MAIGNNIGSKYTWTDSAGKKYTVDPASAGGYMKNYEQYAQDRQAQLDASRDALRKTLTQNNATTNANYDNSARQAYVDYMRRQKALPSQLQALGVNGGATESALLNLYSNYGASHAANEQQRNADLTSNQNSYDDAYNTAYQQYLADLNEQKQTALNNQINEYKNEVTSFSATVAQYPSTEKGYEKYKKWIENLQKSSDPLKDIKVALVRQQMASQFPDGKPKGGSGSSSGRRGGRSYGGRGSSGGSSSGSPSYSDIGRSYAESIRTGTSKAVGETAASGSKPKKWRVNLHWMP